MGGLGYGAAGQIDIGRWMLDTQKRIARRISITGVVQGVGFRPFVYNLAREKGLAGWVLNHSGGVDIVAEGPEAALEAFIIDLEAKAPPLAGIESLEAQPVPLQGFGPFEIRHSQSQEGRYQLISPDVATCPDCLRELLDPKDRRYRYPFINCTNCGPRFTIIQDIPYDRPQTTMHVFPMCNDCLAEYEDPGNRRFHAQPNACPACGPQVWLVERANDRIGEWENLRASEKASKQVSKQATRQPDDKAMKPLGAVAPASGIHHPTSSIPHPASDLVFARARELLLAGKILAIKGLGGFHLACDATNAEAVATLRERKRRPHKPFAIMVATLDDVRALCEVPEGAEKLLTSPQSPIVLLNAKDDTPIAPNVAPNSHTLGVMIPTTPLHHILLRDVGRPLVMTSGNVTEEPIAKDNDEALRRLAPLADAFLLHNRDIHARYDDSVVQVVGNGKISEWENQRITESANERESEKARKRKGNNAWHPVCKGSAVEDRPQRDASIHHPTSGFQHPASNIQHPASGFAVPARRARGYAPLPIRLPFTMPQIFAAGPLLKNTFTLTRDQYAFVSQHIGDLESLETLEHYEAALATYQHLFRIEPEIVVSDLHPDYLSTRLAETFAREHSLPAPYRVQHHQAHISACLADCGWAPNSELADSASADSGSVIGVALDGTGYGEDGHIWGGEWFVGDYRGFERVAHLAYLPLPGGDAAIRHPWRIAVAYLHALGLDEAMHLGEFCPADVMRVRTMVDRGLNTPLTSSMGRLFDAVSALLGICHEATYEAQAAIELEQVAGWRSATVADWQQIAPYPFGLDTGTSPYQIQVGTLLDAILEDVERAEPAALIA